MISVLVLVLAVAAVLLVANAVSPWPAYAAKLAFGKLVLFVHGYDPAFACYAIDSHADLRAELARAHERIEELEEALVDVAEVALPCREVKAANYEETLEAISQSQNVPPAYLRSLARAALAQNEAS